VSLVHDPQISRVVRRESITFQLICPCGEVFDERPSELEAFEDLKLHLRSIS
jgi:hypothetical protein